MDSERIPSIHTGEDYVTRYGGDAAAAAHVDEVLEDCRRTGPGADLYPNIWEQMVHNPDLARRLLGLHDYLLHRAGWTDRPELTELVLQVANRELGSTYLHMARLDAGFEAGLSAVKLASLDFVREELFSEEERFLIEFTVAVLRCSVSDAQFTEAASRFGDKGALQLIVTIATWRWLSMVANVVAPRPRSRWSRSTNAGEMAQ